MSNTKNKLVRRERSSSVGLNNVVNASTAASAVAESSSPEKSRYRQYVSYQSAVINSNNSSSSSSCNKQALDNHIGDHAVVAGIPTILPLSAATASSLTSHFGPPSVTTSSTSASTLPSCSMQSVHHGNFGSIPPTMSTTSADASVISVDYAIEQVGFGMFQYMVLLACALCNASDGMSVMLLSFLAPVLMVNWDLSTEEAARLTSMIFAGALLGTLVLGPMSDQYGRRPVFLLSASIVVCGGVLTAISPNYGTCMLTVFGLGTGIGGMSVPFDILAEFLPSGGRGTNLLRINYAWTIGTIYVVGMAFSFLQGYTPAWRLVTLLTVMPCAVSLMIGYWFVPESPHWLASKGRLREAMHVLRIAAASNGHDSAALFPDHVALQPVWGEKHASVTDLFQPKWRELTLLLWGAWFTSAFGYYGTLLVTTRVFSYADHSSNHSGNVMDYNAIFVSSCAELVGTTVAIAVVDRIGRIQTQVLAFWMAGILLCLLCILAEWNAPRWALLVLSFGARVFEMIGPSVIWISTAECLPTDIRGTGHSMAAALSRLGAFFCPFLIESRTPLIHVGAVMLVAHICTVCCVSRLPETTGRGMGSSSHIDADEKTVGESELLLLSMSTRSVK